jgi:tRNA(Ile)-lysidine synthase
LEAIPDDAALLAAVSGGADSTAMLAAAAAVRGSAFRKSGKLRVIHVNHGLRPEEECAQDARAVQALCDKLGLACAVAVIERGLIEEWAREKGCGIEAAARRFRHEALRREAEKHGAAFILIAHTQDDALETALMRMLRGAGPQGLALLPVLAPVVGGRCGGCLQPSALRAGLPARGAPPAEGGSEARGRSEGGDFPPQIFRPLLEVTRKEVLAFLAERGLSWRTDSTNADPRYLRNRIRRYLTPVLDEYFPFWRKGVLETARTQALTADFIAASLKQTVRQSESGGLLSIENWGGLPDLLREEALFSAIDRLKADDRTVRREAVRRFSHDERLESADAGAGIRVSRKEPVWISRAQPFFEKGRSLLIKEAGEYTMGGLEINVAKTEDGLVVHIKGKQHG